jgi:hypothetical protein
VLRADKRVLMGLPLGLGLGQLHPQHLCAHARTM